MERDEREDAGWVTHPWVASVRHSLQFGVMGGPLADWPRLRAFVAEAEALGYDSYWTFDHPFGNPDWATNLAALAVTTHRIRLGTLAVSVQYRSAALLAREAADIDRLSAGRLVLGLGGGDVASEFTRLGLHFGRPKERLAAVRETVEIVRGAWAAEPFSYGGAVHRVAGANVRPGPVQQPRVPLLIAGGGEQITLRLVARYADASNFGEHPNAGGAATLDDIQRKLRVLDTHCRGAGRSPDSVLRTHLAIPFVLAQTATALDAKLDALPERWRSIVLPLRGTAVGLLGTPEEAVAYFRDRRAAGLQYFVARIMEDDRETLRLLADRVIPALRTAPPVAAATPGDST